MRKIWKIKRTQAVYACFPVRSAKNRFTYKISNEITMSALIAVKL